MPLQKASERIPILARHLVSDRAKQTLDAVQKFVEEECIPADAIFQAQLGSGTKERFSAHPPIIEELKTKAKALGLWNLFLPKNHFKQGAGFSNLEYGLMAEWLGRSVLASEVLPSPFPSDGVTLNSSCQKGHEL
jgi:acyl-CoA dehydrogenase